MKRKQRLTLELPTDFVDRCAADGVMPETVLRDFIADVADIIKWASAPHADGYGSNGSDEREKTPAYCEPVGYPYLHR